MRKNGLDDFAHDVWSYLPQRFTLVYGDLVAQGLSSVGSSVAGYGRRRGGEQSGPLGSDRALELKKRIDRTLRNLAIEIDTGEKQPRVKCGGCGKYALPEWAYCAWCGASAPATAVLAKEKGFSGLPLT